MKLELRNLIKRYGDGGHDLEVLSSLNYSFPESGIVAVVGRSGVGKSTLLQLIGGLDTPTSGDVFFDKVSISNLRNDALSDFRGKNIGFVFQFHHLLPEFNAVENVAMPLIIQGVTEDESLRRAGEVLKRVGLENRGHHRPGALSGGEQQRVAIARAIVGAPPLLLLDEPTGNLDMDTAKVVQKLLFDLQRELNNLMVIVTHSVELASEVDMVLEMTAGGALSLRNKKGFS